MPIIRWHSTTPVGANDFEQRGSRLDQPDILPIFWGPYWSASNPGAVTPRQIMDTFAQVCAGPYFDKLKQYGYVGPATIRIAQFELGPPPPVTFVAGAPQLFDQENFDSAAFELLKRKFNGGDFANIDDNKNFLAVLFVDPTVPDTFQSVSTGQKGSGGWHSDYSHQQFLDDDVRFSYAVILCRSQNLSTVTQILCHELVESITDPLPHITDGVSRSGPLNEIGDVCNQPALVNGISAVAYWSQEDQACVVPTTKHHSAGELTYGVQVVGQTDDYLGTFAFDLGPICGSGTAQCTQRTFDNLVTLRVDASDFERPVFNWSINGTALNTLPPPDLGPTLEVPAMWHGLPPGVHAPREIRPDGMPLPPWQPPNKRATATLRPRTLPFSPTLTIEVGPHQGNVNFHVDVTVSEVFDDDPSYHDTWRTRSADVGLKNQEIFGDAQYTAALTFCQNLMNKLRNWKVGPAGRVGVPHPGDPPDLGAKLSRLLNAQSAPSVEDVRAVADSVRASRPDLAQTLMDLAQVLLAKQELESD
jgi:hypothetical protein